MTYLVSFSVKGGNEIPASKYLSWFSDYQSIDLVDDVSVWVLLSKIYLKKTWA